MENQAKDNIDFAQLERWSKEGRSDDITELVDHTFPAGSSIALALKKLEARGAKCGKRVDPQGIIRYSCVKYLPAPFGHGIFGSIAWNIFIEEGDVDIIRTVLAARSRTGL